MDGLPYGALHQVDVTHDLVRKSIPEVLVELSVLKVVYKHDNMNKNESYTYILECFKVHLPSVRR